MVLFENQQELHVHLRPFLFFSGQILNSPYRLLYIYVHASYENFLVHQLQKHSKLDNFFYSYHLLT